MYEQAYLHLRSSYFLRILSTTPILVFSLYDNVLHLQYLGQEKRAASLSQNPRVGSSKINTNRRVNTLVGSTARIK